jgi:co-chaperonin GroES (HSP10)
MKLKAIYNAVILKPYEFEEELHGNIIVPDLGNEKNKIGSNLPSESAAIMSLLSFH